MCEVLYYLSVAWQMIDYILCEANVSITNFRKVILIYKLSLRYDCI